MNEDREEAARLQAATEEMIRMREPRGSMRPHIDPVARSEIDDRNATIYALQAALRAIIILAEGILKETERGL
jgi:hypothetical protein